MPQGSTTNDLDKLSAGKPWWSFNNPADRLAAIDAKFFRRELHLSQSDVNFYDSRTYKKTPSEQAKYSIERIERTIKRLEKQLKSANDIRDGLLKKV